MTAEIIKTDIKDYIATVTIDRPPVNAMNRQMFDEIQSAFDALNNRGRTRRRLYWGWEMFLCRR